MINETMYSPKELQFGENGRTKLIRGVMKMSAAVKSTLGPGGNTVLIESPNHTHGLTVTKDGVTVAKAVDLIDPVENLAVKMMKEAAERTATSAGDGTTTAIVLTEALVLNGQKYIKPEHNRTEVLRQLQNGANKIISQLKKRSKKISSTMMTDVATVSCNNDRVIGKIIADVYKELGKNGIVTVEKSQTEETYCETTFGLKFDRGYLSNSFINNHKRDECVFEDTKILVADIEISNIFQIEKILKPIIEKNESLLIISPCSAAIIQTISANVAKNNMKICIVPPPGFGYKQHELMNDIADSIGAKYFSEKTGEDLSHMTYADLGFAKKIIVSKDKTIIIKPDTITEEHQEVINKKVSELWEAHELARRKADKDFIKERIASLTGGVGVIFVGGNTDLEQKELFDRVDDAVCAVRSAIDEGILPGAGKALYEMENPFVMYQNEEAEAAANILMDSLKAPLTQILANAGFKIESKYDGTEAQGFGYNLKSGDMGDLIAMGVIDPTKVTRSALQNAVSVAITIMSTNAIITMARTFEPSEPQTLANTKAQYDGC